MNSCIFIRSYEQAFPNCMYLPLTNTKNYATSLKHILSSTYAKKKTKPNHWFVSPPNELSLEQERPSKLWGDTY